MHYEFSLVSGRLLKAAFPHFRAITLAQTRAAAPIAVGAGQPERGRSKAARRGSRFNRPPLAQAGLVVPEPSKRPKQSFLEFAAEQPNDLVVSCSTTTGSAHRDGWWPGP